MDRVNPFSKLTFSGESLPNPEVKMSIVRRRRHTVEYKLKILKQADLCRGESGAIAALLRSEGLYSSILSLWKKQRDAGALSAMSVKRGRKPRFSSQELENQQLSKEKSRLEARLRQAELIIDLQKKVAALLGAPIIQDETIS